MDNKRMACFLLATILVASTAAAAEPSFLDALFGFLTGSGNAATGMAVANGVECPPEEPPHFAEMRLMCEQPGMALDEMFDEAGCLMDVICVPMEEQFFPPIEPYFEPEPEPVPQCPVPGYEISLMRSDCQRAGGNPREVTNIIEGHNCVVAVDCDVPEQPQAGGAGSGQTYDPGRWENMRQECVDTCDKSRFTECKVVNGSQAHPNYCPEGWTPINSDSWPNASGGTSYFTCCGHPKPVTVTQPGDANPSPGASDGGQTGTTPTGTVPPSEAPVPSEPIPPTDGTPPSPAPIPGTPPCDAPIPGEPTTGNTPPCDAPVPGEPTAPPSPAPTPSEPTAPATEFVACGKTNPMKTQNIHNAAGNVIGQKQVPSPHWRIGPDAEGNQGVSVANCVDSSAAPQCEGENMECIECVCREMDAEGKPNPPVAQTPEPVRPPAPGTPMSGGDISSQYNSACHTKARDAAVAEQYKDAAGNGLSYKDAKAGKAVRPDGSAHPWGGWLTEAYQRNCSGVCGANNEGSCQIVNTQCLCVVGSGGAQAIIGGPLPGTGGGTTTPGRVQGNDIMASWEYMTDEELAQVHTGGPSVGSFGPDGKANYPCGFARQRDPETGNSQEVCVMGYCPPLEYCNVSGENCQCEPTGETPDCDGGGTCYASDDGCPSKAPIATGEKCLIANYFIFDFLAPDDEGVCCRPQTIDEFIDDQAGENGAGLGPSEEPAAGSPQVFGPATPGAQPGQENGICFDGDGSMTKAYNDNKGNAEAQNTAILAACRTSGTCSGDLDCDAACHCVKKTAPTPPPAGTPPGPAPAPGAAGGAVEPGPSEGGTSEPTPGETPSPFGSHASQECEKRARDGAVAKEYGGASFDDAKAGKGSKPWGGYTTTNYIASCGGPCADNTGSCRMSGSVCLCFVKKDDGSQQSIAGGPFGGGTGTTTGSPTAIRSVFDSINNFFGAGTATTPSGSYATGQQPTMTQQATGPQGFGAGTQSQLGQPATGPGQPTGEEEENENPFIQGEAPDFVGTISGMVQGAMSFFGGFFG